MATSLFLRILPSFAIFGGCHLFAIEILLRETLATALVSPTAAGAPAAAGLPGGPRGGRELLVITVDHEDALEEEGLAIRVIPAWKWLDCS